MRPEASDGFSIAARPSSSDLTETISFDGDGDTFTSVTFPDLGDGEVDDSAGKIMCATFYVCL